MTKPPAMPTTNITMAIPAVAPFDTPEFLLLSFPGLGLPEGVTGAGDGGLGAKPAKKESL